MNTSKSMTICLIMIGGALLLGGCGVPQKDLDEANNALATTQEQLAQSQQNLVAAKAYGDTAVASVKKTEQANTALTGKVNALSKKVEQLATQKHAATKQSAAALKKLAATQKALTAEQAKSKDLAGQIVRLNGQVKGSIAHIKKLQAQAKAKAETPAKISTQH